MSAITPGLRKPSAIPRRVSRLVCACTRRGLTRVSVSSGSANQLINRHFIRLGGRDAAAAVPDSGPAADRYSYTTFARRDLCNELNSAVCYERIGPRRVKTPRQPLDLLQL